ATARVTFRTITGPPSAPVLSAGNLVTVSSYSPPPDAVQQGSAALVATNDCRPTDFYTRTGVLIASWHTAATIGGTSVSAIRLFRMRLSDRAVLTDATFAQASLLPRRHRGLGGHDLPRIRPLEQHGVPLRLRHRQTPR